MRLLSGKGEDSMICGIIDMGANSVRLSIYRVEEKEARLLLNKKETVGLASYVKKQKAVA